MKKIFFALIIFCCCIAQMKLFGQSVTGGFSFEVTTNTGNFPNEASWELVDGSGRMFTKENIRTSEIALNGQDLSGGI